MILVQLSQSPIQVVTYQGNRQLGRAIDDANPKFAKRAAEFFAALDADRLNADRALLEIGLRDFGGKTEARPIGSNAAAGSALCRDDIGAIDQALERLVDFVGREMPVQVARDIPKALAALANGRRQRAVELTMEKELPVLRIEAHHIGRLYVDGEVRCELRNVLAVTQRRDVLGIACHEVCTRTFVKFAGAKLAGCQQLSSHSRASGVNRLQMND